MSYKISGSIKHIEPTQNVSDRFRKRELILDVPNFRNELEPVKLEFVQDRVDMLDAYHEGEMVEVDFDVKGREWTKGGKTSYFNSLVGWRIRREGGESSSTSGYKGEIVSAAAASSASTAVEDATVLTDDEGELPF